jgi:Amt family ammonium transporter
VLVTGAVAGLFLPLGVYLVERILRLPDETAAVALGIVGGLWGSLAVALFADRRWGQGWNGVGAEESHTVIGQGVTGFLPAEGFIGDGPGQLVDQLAGIGTIGLLASLVRWLVFLALNLPYRPRKERKPRVRKAEERVPKSEAEDREPEQEESDTVEDVPEPEAEEARGEGISSKIGEAVARWGELLRR